MIVAYIDAYRDRFGRADLPGAHRARHAERPGTYYAHKSEPASQADWDDAHRANTARDAWRAKPQPV